LQAQILLKRQQNEKLLTETIPETVNKPCIDECVYEAICPIGKMYKLTSKIKQE